MALFKKLSEQMNISKIKSSPLSESERAAIEKDLIFGTLIEDLDEIVVSASVDAGQPDPDELATVDATPKAPEADLVAPPSAE